MVLCIFGVVVLLLWLVGFVLRLVDVCFGCV